MMFVRKIFQTTTIVGYLALTCCIGVAVVGVCNIRSAAAADTTVKSENITVKDGTLSNSLTLAQSFLQAFGVSNAANNLGANQLGSPTFSFTFINNVWTVTTNFTPYTYQYQGGQFVRK